MSENDGFSREERLLLIAAAAHGLGPQTDLSVASSHKVVGQAMRWAGALDDPIVQTAWDSFEYCREILDWYGALIRMAHHEHRTGPGRAPERPGPTHFEMGGNIGTARRPHAFPRFTSCRLTTEGLRVATTLAKSQPELRL